MESKASENKTIKTIVPIRGNLLEKIKNKLKHNGSSSQSSEVNDAVNNNKETPKVAKVPATAKKASKIEIQKVEKVNLEIGDLMKSATIRPSKSLIIREASPKLSDIAPDKCTKSVTQINLHAAKETVVEDVPKILPKDDAILIVQKEDMLTSLASSKPVQTDKNNVAQKKKVEDTTKSMAAIDNSNMSEEEEEGECMDIGNEDWLNDISVMIGESRIREIDQSLKKIPVTVTGNRIQTENVELKLIINHLLEKLKAKSVIETVEAPSTSNFQNSRDSSTMPDYTDSFDDVTTELSEDEENTVGPVQSFKKEEELIIEPNTFSVPLKDNGAIVTVTVPSIQDIPVDDVPQKQETGTDDIKTEASKGQANIVKEEAPKNKRRGRPPLASSTAKKAKTNSGKSIKKEQPIQDCTDHPRKLSLRSSSRESSVESCKKEKSPVKTATKKSTTSNLQRTSSRETLLKTAISKQIETKQQSKKTTRVKELSASENSSVKKSSESSVSSSECENDCKGRLTRRKSRRDLAAESLPKITDFFKQESPDKNVIQEVPLPINDVVETEEKNNNDNKKKANGQVVRQSTRRKKRKILSSSESDSEDEKNTRIPPRRKSELKSVTNANDFNSLPLTTTSSIIERYDYLRKSSVDNPALIKNLPICDELKDMVAKSKEQDPTYLKPPDMTKRPYLITSAFTGNHSYSDDSSHTLDSSMQPSVSRDDSSLVSSNMDNSQMEDCQDSKLGIKDIMKNLIKKQKEKIHMKQTKQEQHALKSVESTSPLSPKNDESNAKSRKNKRSKTPQTSSVQRVKTEPMARRLKEVEKKEFKQEELEDPIESLVCYEEIIESIRITNPLKKNGRALASMPLDVKKKEALERKLRDLKHFTCGSCNFLVTKHKWKDHLMAHGGLAWIESFESPIDINDWNESVRRLNNCMKIFKLESFCCPNCSFEKRSALGHMSHVYTCAESEESLENRKVPCKYCQERVLPYNMSWHRKKCEVLTQDKLQAVAEEGDAETTEDDETSRSSAATKDSTRGKRKAGKKALKKFQKFLQRQKDHYDHYLVTSSGSLVCHHCGEEINSEARAIEHLEKSHEYKREDQDFEPSASDASVNENDESSETDGSSGVESSEIQSAEEDLDLCDSNNVYKNPKAKATCYDSEELKASRRLVASYVDSFPNFKVSQRTIKQTKEFYDANLCDNILVEFSPKYKALEGTDLASQLAQLKFGLVSMKFTIRPTDYYNLDVGAVNNPVWKQLNVGTSLADRHQLTLFCGGSVSSLDWSTSNDGKVFLAVACNSAKERLANLEETSKTCIQIYEFEDLVNENLSTFEDISKLRYFFTVNEGPVWCIKFHPLALSTTDRIGLLAVTSSNHHVYIYSLPYLKKDAPSMISLEPIFICKTTHEFWLFQEKYLMQSTVVSWFFRKENDMHLLAAGFINGMISIWNFDEINKSEEEECTTVLPYMTFQPHHEPVTGLDFKYMLGSEIFILTTALDRHIKVFTLDNNNIQEISSYYSASRIMCAQWWLNWPGYICGNDACYSHGTLTHRQPLEFATRSMQLFYCVATVMSCNLSDWMNVALFTTDAGDVLCTNPPQLIHVSPKDRWTFYGNNVLSYTDVITLNENNETGIVFYDINSKLQKRPKDFRSVSSIDNVNQLQINQISFSRNEKSCRFYALAYETGFVRVKYLKNAK